LELGSDLTVTITVEDAPSPEGRLREHLALNLAFQVASVCLDADVLRSATRACTHLEISGVVLETVEGLRSLIELEMPKRLLFDTLRVGLEVGHQILDLLDLGVGVGVENLREILHESEIGTHRISQARQLAQLGNESNLVSRAAILVDEQRLILVVDSLVVASTVVL